MTTFKKRIAGIDDDYASALRKFQEYNDEWNDDYPLEDFYNLANTDEGKNSLRSDFNLSQKEIRALEALLKKGITAPKLDNNTQKEVLVLLKALAIGYHALVAIQNGQSDLATPLKELFKKIKERERKENIFGHIQRHVFTAVQNDATSAQIDRHLKSVRGILSSDREIGYACRAVYKALSKIRPAEIEEVKDVLNIQGAKQTLQALADNHKTPTELASVSLTAPSSRRVNTALIELCEKIGPNTRAAAETAEVKNLFQRLQENKNSGKSVSEILSEQNKIIDEAFESENLDADLVQIIKVLNEADVLVNDGDRQTKIGNTLALTKEQEDAMLSDGLSIISAGAGSGKTRVLAGRVAHLIHDQNVDPYSIIACSFSKKSAQDLREKIQSTVGRSLKNVDYTTIGRTTHSIAIEIANRFDPETGNYKIIGEFDIANRVKEAIKLASATMPKSGTPASDGFFRGGKVEMKGVIELKKDLRVLNMLMSTQNYLHSKYGKDIDDVMSLLQGAKKALTKGDSLEQRTIQTIQELLSTRAGKKTVARAFGGTAYTFPASQTQRGSKKKASSGEGSAQWWGWQGALSGEAKIPSPRACQLFITKCKARMISPTEAFNKVKDHGEEFILKAKVYGAYQSLLEGKNERDFDDLLIRGVQVLSSDKNLKELRKQYKHIIVDEAQDLNPVQHAFFGLLAGTYKPVENKPPVPVENPQIDEENNSYTLIGDENQSIYGFRGATSAEFTSKARTDSNTEGAFTLKSIGVNFRSDKAIVDAANRLAKSDGLGLVCTSVQKSEAEGSITALTYENESASARSVAEEIKVAMSDTVGKKASDFGIACRTNQELVSYCLALLEKDVPFRSGVNPFSHHSTRAIVRLMNIGSDGISERNSSVYNSWRDLGYAFPNNFDKALRNSAKELSVNVYEVPSKLITEAFVDGNPGNLLSFIDELNLEDDDKRNEVVRYLNMVANWIPAVEENPKKAFDITLGYQPYKEESYIEGPNGEKLHEILEGKVREADKQFLTSISSEESDASNDAESLGNEEVSEEEATDYNLAPLPALRKIFMEAENVSEALKKINSLSRKAEQNMSDDETRDAVTLDTVHGWKGLEVENIYVPMNKGKFPSEKVEFDPIVHESEDEAKAEKAEQEKKLAYVAVTRGMKSVKILTYEKNNKGDEMGASEFVGQLGLPCDKQDKTASRLATALSVLAESVHIEDFDLTDEELDEALSGAY